MIHVKIVNNRFVRVIPPVAARPDDEPTFPQHIVKTKSERRHANRANGGIDGPSGLYEQIRFKEDHAQ